MNTSLSTKSHLLPLFMVTFLFLFSCKDSEKKRQDTEIKEEAALTEVPPSEDLFFKLSLAEWSLHIPIQNGNLDPMNFAEKAHEYGFQGMEYVSAFYQPDFKNADDPKAALQKILDTLKAKSEKYNLRNVLIMVDNEGELATSDEKERNSAVENHKKWIDAAQFLGCHSIRVNLFGSNEAQEWKNNSVKALQQLCDYASPKGVNVLVENHGYLSSNAELLAQVMEAVNRPSVGTLPDFGNFCLKREGGARWDAKCIEEYPRYKGVKQMMPYAKGVSAKSYNFNDQGEETTIDFGKMLQIVKDAGYDSYIGVEYEGEEMPPKEGIMATKELLIEKAKQVTAQ
ncbi:MAG: sugar phosphate isomerase/epimerase family protein [Salegentibacter sp.]